MPHDTTLIATIVGGLVLAFALGFVADRFRLPPLVGYLLAGVAVGPHTPGFVADTGLALQLAEIGVILLMFAVGLHFSIKDLLVVRKIAVPGAVVQIATATAIGTGLAYFWGWGLGGGLVFGLALSVASTVVLLRALEERNALDSDNGRIAVGWLIVEDLAMVLTLVLLPALAPTLASSSGAGGGGGEAVAAISGNELALSIVLTLAKVAIFVTLVLVVGRRLVPQLLALVARSGSRELFTLAVLAIALGIAYGSVELFDVSFALGAFFAGVVLSESDLSHQAAADTLPLQDAFSVLFFVSVGMLFDPTILVDQPLAVLAVVAIIVFGKSLAAFLIVLAFGYSVATALIVSASLAQIGEFSFILAGLGLSLGLLPSEGKDLILAGALLSITLNPFVFAGSDRLAAWIQRRPKLQRRLEWAKPEQGAPSLAVSDETPMRDHAVIVGFGRVGETIGNAFDIWELPYVVVERDRRLIEDLRARGVRAVFGSASAPGILSAADIEHARLLIIAAPDPYAARRVLELARALNPDIDTVVRTHSEVELAHLEAEGVGLAVLAERELALGMMGYALRSLGLSEGEARLFVQSSRRFDDAGMVPKPKAHEKAPELRPQQRDG
ncbi:MAG: YbaL family putative K(+) efflux transporter [Rhodospirillales bacterium]